MRKIILALALLSSPALAQNMSAAEMAQMHIGPAIQHGPRGKPLTSPAQLAPIRTCRQGPDPFGPDICVTVQECRPGGPRPCRKSPEVPQ